MFKKLLALAMCFALVLTFAACGGNGASDDTDNKDDTSSTSSSSAPTFEGTVDEQIGAWANYKKLIDLEAKDQGRNLEIIGRGESLVYVYTYNISFSDPTTVFGNVEESLDAKESKYKEMHRELKTSVPTAKSVIIEYYTMEGELALSKTFIDGQDVVTGGAYASSGSSGSTAAKGIYGTWTTDYDITDSIDVIMMQAYPEATVEAETVTAEYVLQFTEDGKCIASINAAELFYDALIKTAEKHIKTTTTDEATVKTELDNFKATYTMELVKENMNSKDEGTFTLTGDPETTGTIELDGDNMEGSLKFTVSGNSLTLIPLSGGEEHADGALTFTRK